MSKRIRDTKLRTLIKAYLVFRKGKKVTAKEISDWINGNSFSMNNATINPGVISYLIRQSKFNNGSMLYDVRSEKRYNLSYYWVD